MTDFEDDWMEFFDTKEEIPVTYPKDTKDRRFYVYVINRIYNETGIEEVCYVGRGRASRYKSHIYKLENNRHINKILQNWYNKQDSIFEPIKVKIHLTNDEANLLEKELIAHYGRYDLGLGRLANLTDGGDGLVGRLVSQAEREKLSLLHRTRVRSVQHGERISKSKLGHVQSPETRAKISEVQKGRKLTEGHRENISLALKGKPKKAEHNAKVSASNKGKPKSEEHKKSLSIAAKRRWAKITPVLSP